MSLDLDQPKTRPLRTAGELLAYFQQAQRPVEARRVGLEHEKLLAFRESGAPVPYEGERGVQALLRLLAQMGWAEFREAEGQPVIALMRGQATVSLEPGGQLELSGSPFATAREAHEENLAHLEQVREACAELSLVPVALGYRPFGTPDQMPWMPKQRYRAMREVLPRRGGLARDMMQMTATGQVSLDFTDEADCARKITTAARLNPILVALFANSPVVAGKISGYLSYRSHVWTDVDPARCGVPPFFLDGTFSYQRYVDWALAAPLLFLRRGKRYLTPQLTFGELLERGFEGEPAYESDWADHLSTLFPEVRLKKVIEIRGADCVSAGLTGALAALWRGLFYDGIALTEAGKLVAGLEAPAYAQALESARRDGLAGHLGDRPLSKLAVELLEIAHRGLLRLDPLDAPLLAPLRELAASGSSPAQAVLEAFQEDPDPARLLARFAV